MSVTNATSSLVTSPNQLDLGRTPQLEGQKSLSLSRFEAALEKAGTPELDPATQAQNAVAQAGPESFRVAQVTSPNVVSDAGGTGLSSVDTIAQSDRTRALRGLDLSKEASTADQNTTGQGILDGLSNLRGVFDNQEAAITGISSTSLSNSTQLINLQLEVVKYSMLMDVTSKLTGKATQSFDTLMKGQ